jgi:hypothetical protein
MTTGQLSEGGGQGSGWPGKYGGRRSTPPSWRLANPDPDKAGRAMQAMLQMKIDIASASRRGS